MTVNLEHIDMLRERAGISYKEAKEILEKYNGDVLEALIKLESEAKVKAPQAEGGETGCWTTTKKLTKSVQKLIRKGNQTKFVIRKGDSTVIDLPVNIVILATVVTTPVMVAGVLVALVTHHKIAFVKSDGEGLQINETLDKISSCVTSAGDRVAEAINKD